MQQNTPLTSKSNDNQTPAEQYKNPLILDTNSETICAARNFVAMILASQESDRESQGIFCALQVLYDALTHLEFKID